MGGDAANDSTNDAPDDFDAFIRAQWQAHSDDAQAVGQRLAESLARVRTAAEISPYAGLATHVFGVHLSQWDRGAEILTALRQTRGYDASPLAEGPIARSLASLGLARGDARAADALPAADRVAALAMASSALLDRDALDRAIELFTQALDLAGSHPVPDGVPAVRHLAVGGNNLAAALEERATRSPAETAAMLRAAQAGVTYWRRCGGWLEHERAEYRLARSLLRGGRAAESAAAARRCIAICERELAPDLECFFGHAIHALALAADGHHDQARAERDRALSAHAKVPASEQAWCADDLAEMLAATGRPTA